MVDLVIENGTVVTAEREVQMDVGVTDGTITRLTAPGEIEAHGAETIDAADRYVFPGFIDSHVHAKLSLGEFTTVDEFDDLTKAAALGGTTTILSFAIPSPDETPLDAFNRRCTEADGNAFVDYGFHGCVTDSRPVTIEQIPELLAEGAASIKAFMVYEGRLRLDDGELHTVMEAVAEAEGLLLVHAENNEIISSLVAEQTAAGNADYSVHGKTHPPVSETVAMWTVAELVEETQCPTLLVHVSNQGAQNVLRAAKTRELPLIAETCPHYLTLTEEVYDQVHGERYVCSPPVRSSLHRDALWEMIDANAISMVNSDHCGYTTLQKERNRDDVTRIPNGLPGVETCNTVLYSEGVDEREISLQKFVELASTNVAKAFGLYPRKGTIAVGADADLVVFDPTLSRTVDSDNLGMASDYSPFEGLEVTGTTQTVLVRGKKVVSAGELVGERGHGNFVETSAETAKETFRRLGG